MLHFFPCHLCASLPRRVIVGLADTVDRHYHPKPPWHPDLLGEHWPPSALTARWGPVVLPLWGVCCAVHLELPLPMVVPTPGAPYNGQGLTRLQSCTRHTNNDTINALERRVWRCTTTENFSLHAP